MKKLTDNKVEEIRDLTLKPREVEEKMNVVFEFNRLTHNLDKVIVFDKEGDSK